MSNKYFSKPKYQLIIVRHYTSQLQKELSINDLEVVSFMVTLQNH